MIKSKGLRILFCGILCFIRVELDVILLIVINWCLLVKYELNYLFVIGVKL